MNLFVLNLPYCVTVQDLERAFSPFGEVVRVRIPVEHGTAHSRGFGFVEMRRAQDGQKAISAMNDSDMSGRKIKVTIAQR